MKAKLSCILVVLGVVTVSFAQREPRNLGVLIMLDSTTVELGQQVHIDVYVENAAERNVTIRELEVYCRTADQGESYEPMSMRHLTIEGGEIFSFDLNYEPTCPGTWVVECMLRFGGSGKNDLMSLPKEFTVY